MEFEKAFWDYVADGLRQGFAAIAIAVIMGGLGYGAKWAYDQIRFGISYFQRMNAARAAVSSPAGLWHAEPIVAPEWYTHQRVASGRVVCVANLKGGVGKTTVTANLGASIAARHPGLEVVLIDFDFQGSLSSMAYPDGRHIPAEGHFSSASHLVAGELTPSVFSKVLTPIGDLPNLKIVPAFYDLARRENQRMVEWLIGPRRDDVRYEVARVLLSDEAYVQDRIYLIDCPPRLTTATVQAFCAASHVLIPTILNRTSASAVETFVEQVLRLQGRRDAPGIAPHIDFAGVLPTMVSGKPVALRGTINEQTALRELRKIEAHYDIEVWEPALDHETVDTPMTPSIPRLVALENPQGVSYLRLGGAADSVRLRDQLDNAADKLLQKMGIAA